MKRRMVLFLIGMHLLVSCDQGYSTIDQFLNNRNHRQSPRRQFAHHYTHIRNNPLEYNGKLRNLNLPICSNISGCSFPCQSPFDYKFTTVYDLPESKMCDGIAHCKYGIDERQCDDENKTSNTTFLFSESFRCLDYKLVIPWFQLCDGVIHCKDASDEALCVRTERSKERLCEDIFPYNLDDENCTKLFCVQPQWMTKWIQHKLPKLRNISCHEINAANKYSSGHMEHKLHKCNTSEDYLTGDDLEDSMFQNLNAVYDLDLMFPFAFADDLIPTCPFGDDEMQWILEHENDDSSHDEWYYVACSFNQELCDDSNLFSCGVNDSYLTVDAVCDGHKDCSNGRDECRNCHSDGFSDDQHLIPNIGIKVLIWTFGIIATIANTIQIIDKTIVLIRNKPKLQNSAKINHVHLWSLALSDLLVGVFLLILGIQTVAHDGDDFCLTKFKYQGGLQCSFMGGLGFIGSQMSVNVLTLITLQRLYTIQRPFAKSSVIFATIRIVIAWIATVFLAILPVTGLLDKEFLREIVLEDNILWDSVNKTEISKLAESVESNRIEYNLPSQKGKHLWTWFFEVLHFLNKDIKVEQKLGYYSSSVLCLPNYVNIKEGGEINHFPLAIIIYNFVSFVVIAVSYIVIYRDTMLGRKRDKEKIKMQRKMMWIVGTDFVCWVPICILTFCIANGSDIDLSDFTKATVCILPINSVLNPFIYSNLPQTCMAYLKQILNLNKHEKPSTQNKQSSENNLIEPAMELKVVEHAQTETSSF